MSQADNIVYAVFHQCQIWLRGQQRGLERAYRISRCQWEMSFSHGHITYSHQQQIIARARFVVLGSYHLHKGTWMWGWANPSLDQRHVITPDHVSGLTQALGWGWLTTPVVPVFQRPLLWQDQVFRPNHEHINRTAVARLVSTAAYQVGGCGVHFAYKHNVLACTALTEVYRPVNHS